ncbi:hypothetical protein VTJ04DRAFT_9325 [Mycothermus thermophilus]|uniref:uncharacterized protein n=1 Tax=Humicola insolens TaxID=85995 RepID=UPI0037437D2F
MIYICHRLLWISREGCSTEDGKRGVKRILHTSRGSVPGSTPILISSRVFVQLRSTPFNSVQRLSQPSTINHKRIQAVSTTTKAMKIRIPQTVHPYPIPSPAQPRAVQPNQSLVSQRTASPNPIPSARQPDP